MSSIKSIFMFGQAAVGIYLISKSVLDIWNSSAEMDSKSPEIEIEEVEEDYDSGDFDEIDFEEDWMELCQATLNQIKLTYDVEEI